MDDVTVYFIYDTAHFSLNYPRALVNMSIVNLKKLFRYMLTGNRDVNENAVQITEEVLDHIATVTKAAWHEASERFARKCRDPRQYYDGFGKAEAINHNDNLYKTVKSAESRYYRIIKLQAYFKETKTKYYD